MTTHKTTNTKEVIVKGTQEYLNMETGEIEEFSVISKQERDFNFHKVWLKQFFMAIDELGSRKMKFAIWMIDQMDTQNRIVLTQRQAEKDSGYSLSTINKTIRILQDHDVIRKESHGLYRLNPNLLFKGGMKQRAAIATIYSSLPHEKLTDQEKLANLRATYAALEKEIAKLEGKEESKQTRTPTVVPAASDMPSDKEPEHIQASA